MNTRSLLVRHIAAVSLAFAFPAGQIGAQPTTYNDAINDIDPGISTGGGTLDIVKMEIADSLTDVIFTMTVNGSTAETGWGNFMIGIATTNAAGTTNGNGWGRPINMIPPVGTGMTRWIGSWVTGAEIYSYSGTSWTRDGATWNSDFPGSIVIAPGTQSVITYSIPKTSLGVTTGDTIYFDAYSSGGGGSDSAVDALCNTNVSITSWGGPYTSQTPNIQSYTLNNSAAFVTNNITFSVDMSVQAAFSNFVAPETVSVQYGTGFTNSASLVLATNNVWTNSVPIVALANAAVPYRFVSESPATNESVARSFNMPTNATNLSTVYFNDIQGYRDVTFSVDMSVYINNGLFDTNAGVVEVRGPFNSWAGTALTNAGTGIYSGTVPLIGGLEGQSIGYKYWAGSYELDGQPNRTFSLSLNTNGSPTPEQVLTPTPFYNNVSGGRNITFNVDMTVMEALGRIDTTDPASVVKVVGSFNNWDTGAATYQLTNAATNGIYTGTFFITGNEGSTMQYKFFSPGINYFVAADPNNTGFEIINQASNLQNRTNVLGPTGAATNYSTVFFSDQLFGVMNTVTFPLPASSFTNFTATQGTASGAQSVAISGRSLGGNVVATAPTGFQVSLDGTNYFGSVSLIPSGGTLSSVPLFARIASTASAGVQTNLSLLLTSVGSQYTDFRIGSDVTASPYNAWASGFGLDPSQTTGATAGAPGADPDNDGFNNQSEYAFGTNPTAGNAALLTTSVSGGNMIVTWLQRTDAAAGAYKVKTTSSLATPFIVDAALTAAITDGSASPTPPTGYVRKQVSVAITGEPNFLALAFD